MGLKAKTSSRKRTDKAEAVADLTKEPNKRINPEIPESLFTRIKVHVAQRGITIREFAIAAFTDYLDANE